MKLLLDTHVFIWMDSSPEKLSTTVQQAIINPQNEIYLSLVSLWEMQIKIQLGKLKLSQALSQAVQAQQKSNDILILPIRESHVYGLQNLPLHHGDPFDRLLIAQTQIEQMTLATNDAKIQDYEMSSLW